MTLAVLGQMCFPDAKAQNLIENGSYEVGQEPECWAQGDFASGWESSRVSTGGLVTHSPDLFDDNVNFYAASSCTAPYGQGVGEPKFIAGAHTGSRYMGLAPYELIQQHIPELTPGNRYTASMYIAPNYNPLNGLWNGGTGRLKVGLARNRVKYITGDESEYCMGDYVSYQDGLLQSIHVLGTLDLSISLFSNPNEWRRVSFSFEAPESLIGDFDWFFIDVEIPGFSGSSSPDFDACIGDYVYVDDVGLYDARFCDAACAPDLGPITYWTWLGGDATPNALDDDVIVNTGDAFFMYFENAIEIDMLVFNGWGDVIYRQYEFDVNGLKDPGFTDYEFWWSGEDTDGSIWQSDIYNYTIRVKQCGPTLELFGSFFYEGDPSVPSAYHPGSILNFELEDCCLDNAYFSNISFTGFFQEDVHDFIVAGADAGGVAGPAVVTSASHVVFHAGDMITLLPGFSVEPGGIYLGVISDCIYGSLKHGIVPERRYNWIDDVSHKGYHGIVAFPNPSDGLVSITRADQARFVGSVDVFNLEGRLMISVDHSQGKDIQLDLRNLASGVYIVRLSDESSTYHVQVVRE